MEKVDRFALLMSLRPFYANQIIEGVKTIEFRRKFNDKFEKGTKIILYSSGSVKAIVGECKILQIEKLDLGNLKYYWENSKVNEGNFEEYFHDLNYGYAIFIYNCIKYKSQIPLSKMREIGLTPTMSYRFLTQEQSIMVENLSNIF